MQFSTRDAYMVCVPQQTYNTYFWATLRDHHIMAAFLKYNFDKHPSISSTIMQFMVRTSPIIPMSQLKGEVTRLQTQIAKVPSLPSKVQTLQKDMSMIKKDLVQAQAEIKHLRDKVGI